MTRPTPSKSSSSLTILVTRGAFSTTLDFNGPLEELPEELMDLEEFPLQLDILLEIESLSFKLPSLLLELFSTPVILSLKSMLVPSSFLPLLPPMSVEMESLKLLKIAMVEIVALLPALSDHLPLSAELLMEDVMLAKCALDQALLALLILLLLLELFAEPPLILAIMMKFAKEPLLNVPEMLWI